MKTLNETFTDKEFKEMKKMKRKLSWHDFIILMITLCKEAIKREDFKIEKQ